jgi:hypothetical protein
MTEVVLCSVAYVYLGEHNSKIQIDLCKIEFRKHVHNVFCSNFLHLLEALDKICS